MTRDLWIVGNNKLRKLFTKGPEYRETNNISWEKAKSTITEGLNDCIDTWCSKHGINKSVLMEWKDRVIDSVDEKIKSKSVLPQNNSLNTLSDIQNQFVVNPIYKGNGNVIFLCQ